jgi:hypothetical protein
MEPVHLGGRERSSTAARAAGLAGRPRPGVNPRRRDGVDHLDGGGRWKLLHGKLEHDPNHLGPGDLAAKAWIAWPSPLESIESSGKHFHCTFAFILQPYFAFRNQDYYSHAFL